MDKLDNPGDMHTILLLVDEQGTVIKSLHDHQVKLWWAFQKLLI